MPSPGPTPTRRWPWTACSSPPARRSARSTHRAGDPGVRRGPVPPSQAGTYLAALVIIGALTGRSTEGLSLMRSRIVDLPPAQTARLERAADQANRDLGIP